MGLQDMLAGLFGSSGTGTAPNWMGAAMQLLASQTGDQGGLSGLVERFRDAGFGDIVQSWIGTGQNQPISPDALHDVLGTARVNALADKTGLPADQLLTQLSQHLPGIVDKLTPNGQLPEGGVLQAMLAKYGQRSA